MWKVRLPETGDIEAQLGDALVQRNGNADYDLSPNELAELRALYERYDQLLGEPDASLRPGSLKACGDALHAAYSQLQIGGRMAALRDALLSAVVECPLCGSGSARTLDHHLPHETYRALSVNPRNLVPSCQPCNRAKGTLEPIAGQGMIHAYFQKLPDETFLVATAAYLGGALKFRLSIDPVPLDPAVHDRLEFQLERLKLNERHSDVINVMLFTLKPALTFFRGKPGERDLVKDWLVAAAKSYDLDFGLNHWRTAVLRALAACDAFLDDPWSYFDKPPAALRPADPDD